MRSRKSADLHADARVGHVSASCLHLANVSYRLGKAARVEAITDSVHNDGEAVEALMRYGEHLQLAGIDLAKSPSMLGPWVAYDTRAEQFTGPLAAEATALSRRKCREPYVVPEIS